MGERLLQGPKFSLFPKTYGRLLNEDLYKVLMMERTDVQCGPKAMEGEEPGYLRSVLNGYHEFEETLMDPISSGWLEKIHDAATEYTKTSDYPNGIPAGYRNDTQSGEAFYLKRGDTFSKKGFFELCLRYRTLVDEEFIKFMPQFMIDPLRTIRWEPVEEQSVQDLEAKRIYDVATCIYNSPGIFLRPIRKETAVWIFDFFHELYKNAPKETEYQKLIAIVSFCQNLEQAHLFFDGNIRTIGFFLLNKLLLMNDLNPTSLKDVNCLDCLSVEELIQEVKEGQDYFRCLTSLHWHH